MLAPSTTLPLTEWESFYVIVGSSGAALIGLQFVVMALISDSRAERSHETVRAFGTPTIVHFAAALLVSTVLSAPWRSLGGPSKTLAAAGLAGVAYVAITVIRARRQEGYAPVWQDWLWHTMLPFVAYGALLASALFLPSQEVAALFVIGAVALLLLFIGIHNAWDTVTYIVIDRAPVEAPIGARSPTSPAPPAARPPATGADDTATPKGQGSGRRRRRRR